MSKGDTVQAMKKPAEKAAQNWVGRPTGGNGRRLVKTGGLTSGRGRGGGK
jgi:hypothetical protein